MQPEGVLDNKIQFDLEEIVPEDEFAEANDIKMLEISENSNERYDHSHSTKVGWEGSKNGATAKASTSTEQTKRISSHSERESGAIDEEPNKKNEMIEEGQADENMQMHDIYDLNLIKRELGKSKSPSKLMQIMGHIEFFFNNF